MSFIGFSAILESFGGFLGSVMVILSVLATLGMKDKIVQRLRPIVEEQIKKISLAEVKMTDEQID